MTIDLAFSSAIEVSKAIKIKQLSPVEVVEASLQRLQLVEPRLNCFATVTAERARCSARLAEQAVMSGERVGLLHGLPISVKDLLPVAGVKEMFGSQLMMDNIATVDAPVVERLRAAGACLIGKTTTSEFGCKAVGDSPLTGITRNPWNLNKTPGGSSCGAAASVASGVTPFAIGTDGGGSIRVPSSFTNLFGIKPQFGRVPIYPPTATPSLAHIGLLARSVRDAALLLSAISGYDDRDPFSVAAEVPNFVAACDVPVSKLRLGWSPTLGYANPTSDVLSIVENAVRRLEGMGCELVLLDAPLGNDPIGIWEAEFFAGVGTRLADALRTSVDKLDSAVAKVLIRGLEQDLKTYYANVFDRFIFFDKIRQLFKTIDVLLTPTLPVPPFDVGLNVPPEYGDNNLTGWVAYTYPFNLTGQPAASIPAGFTSAGLPVGLQAVAKPYCEVDLFRIGAALENVIQRTALPMA